MDRKDRKRRCMTGWMGLTKGLCKACYIQHEVSSVSVKVDDGAPKPALFLAETCERPKRKEATEI